MVWFFTIMAVCFYIGGFAAGMLCERVRFNTITQKG